MALNKGIDKDAKLAYQGDVKPRHPDVVEFAGNFNLSSIHLHNHNFKSI